MAVCGLDFGTSNSAVALPTGEVLRIDATAAQPTLFRTVLFLPEDPRRGGTNSLAYQLATRIFAASQM